MQAEQQTVTNQTKKTSSGVKKEKKTTSKAKETTPEVNVEQVLENKTPVTASVVQQAQSEPVVEKIGEVAVVQELEFNNVIDYLNTASDRLLEFSKYFKDNTLSKDERGRLEASFKKFSKANSALQQAYYEYLSKQVSSLEKNSGNKSGGAKKQTDKEKSAIHKKHPVHPFLLTFMKLEPSTLVSRSDALSAITGYVKQEKVTNPDIIVANDKMKFKLIGELKPLFTGIEQVMKSKNLLQDTVMPTEIKYTQIMEYMTHCFIKQEEAVAN
jgi:hypothetical protein